MTRNNRTHDLLLHLASKPGHDEVKADFRQLLIEEFGAELSALDFERRVPEVKGRLDALIGRTVFEAKRNLDAEWDDVVRRMPEDVDAAGGARDEGRRFYDGCRRYSHGRTKAGPTNLHQGDVDVRLRLNLQVVWLA